MTLLSHSLISFIKMIIVIEHNGRLWDRRVSTAYLAYNSAKAFINAKSRALARDYRWLFLESAAAARRRAHVAVRQTKYTKDQKAHYARTLNWKQSNGKRVYSRRATNLRIDTGDRDDQRRIQFERASADLWPLSRDRMRIGDDSCSKCVTRDLREKSSCVEMSSSGAIQAKNCKDAEVKS